MNGLRAAADRIAAWRRDPVLFVRENFGVEPDVWQVKALRAFASDDVRAQRIAMKACKGPGKTAVLAWMILLFMGCYGEVGEHPKGAAVSITGDNLDANLWPEISKWQQRSAYLSAAFTWTKTRFFANDHPSTWFFDKRSWSKTADAAQQANALAGYHAKYILFVLDESGGITDAVMATAEGALSTEGGWHKIVQAGNPTHTEGPLWRACNEERHLWTVIEISGDPDAPDRSPRISVEWAKQQIAKYGRDNPWVLVNVFGQFPPSSLNSLLGPDDVEAAKKRYGALRPGSYSWSQKRLGVDVARFGDDRTVLFPRQGLAAFMPVELRKSRTTDIAARVMVALRKWGKDGSEVMIFVDDTGHWGHGVIDNLLTAGYAPLGIQFHAPAIDERYKNRRAEMWLEMADWFKRGGAIPPDISPELTAELTVPQYTYANGKFFLEDKDQIKERLGRSPDMADALALTFALPDQPDSIQRKVDNLTGRTGDNLMAGAMASDWNPLA